MPKDHLPDVSHVTAQEHNHHSWHIMRDCLLRFERLGVGLASKSLVSAQELHTIMLGENRL
eukprot:4051532-Amphidinium_carterae.1